MIAPDVQILNDPHDTLVYVNNTGTYHGWNPVDKRITWRHNCRMQAGWYIEAKDRFVAFSMRNPNVELIDTIWTQIESSMGLTERTIIHRTDKPNALLFELPAFWTANDTANGMLTLFMRAVCVYGDTDLTKMFKAYDRTARILKTVLWWTNGHTLTTYPALTVKDKDDYIGICAEYDGVSDEKLAAKLVKPPCMTLALKT